MSDTSLEKIEQSVIKTFAQKTPAKYIKTRPGAGGRSFKYVDTAYVVNELNRLFGLFWEWKIADKKIDATDIWIQGELTVKNTDGFSITKTGFGGSKVKTSTSTGKPLDISNDLKAASTLALKKAASLFGIASDIYYPEMDWYEEKSEVEQMDEPSPEDIAANTRSILNRKMFAIAAEKGYSSEDIDKVIKHNYNLDHKRDLTSGQLQELIGRLENVQKKQVVETEIIDVEQVMDEMNKKEWRVT
jgi:recombination DNA repair RAD52 pathway protein